MSSQFSPGDLVRVCKTSGFRPTGLGTIFKVAIVDEDGDIWPCVEDLKANSSLLGYYHPSYLELVFTV